MNNFEIMEGAIAPRVGLGSELIGSVTRWCEFSQGQIEAREFLSAIASATNVDAVGLGRVLHDGSGQTTGVTYDSS